MKEQLKQRIQIMLMLKQENRNELIFFNNWLKIKATLKSEVFMLISVV